MYARLRSAHILGVPACVLHSPATAFDYLFPIVLTGQSLRSRNAAARPRRPLPEVRALHLPYVPVL